MLKATLSAIPIYLMSCISMPSGVYMALMKKLRKLFWQGTDTKKKFALIAWDKVCNPIENGGTGIKNQLWQNKALGAKLFWKIHKEQHLKWVRIIRSKYLTNLNSEEALRVTNFPRGSRIWNFIAKSSDIILNHISWNVKDGKKALFWNDSWGGYPIISNLLDTDRTSQICSEKWGIHASVYIILSDNNQACK